MSQRFADSDYDLYDFYEHRYHHKQNQIDLFGNVANLSIIRDSDEAIFGNLTTTSPFSLASFVCGVAMIVVAFLGSTANTITAYVFSRPTMASSISVLLAGLAVVDACVLTMASPIFAANALYIYWPAMELLDFVSYATVYLYPLASIFQTASVWILTLITVERFVAVCRPFAARTRCTRRRARSALAGVVLSSVAYNVVRFWDYRVYRIYVTESASELSNETLTFGENYSVAIAWPMLRNNEDYVRVYVHWLYFAFVFALPFSALLIFNALVAYTIRRARRERLLLSRRQSKEHATAAMMTVVVLVFLLCNSLAFVLNALEVFGASGDYDEQIDDDRDDDGASPMSLPSGALKPRHSHLFYFLIDANNLLIMLHCSFNFLIYYHFNQRFRLYILIRLRCVRRYCQGRLRRCLPGKASRDKDDEEQKAENDEAIALDELGLELLRLQRGASSRTVVSYLRRVSTREYQPGPNSRHYSGVHRLSSATIAAANNDLDRWRQSARSSVTNNRLSPPGLDEMCSANFDLENDGSANPNC